MKSFTSLLLTAISVCALALTAAPAIPELTDAVKIADFTIVTPGQERTFKLPQLPGKEGMVRVLRCRMSSFGGGGCNKCVRIMFNDTALGMITSGGRPRLLFRELTFTLPTEYGKRKFNTFHGANINLPFAADCDDADRRTGDKLGSYFVFDLTDAANPVDVNTISFRNIRANLPGNNTLTVKDISVGYLPISALPKSKFEPVKVPASSAKSITFAGTRVDVYANGGFSATFKSGQTLAVETGLGMRLGNKPTLRTSGKKPVQPLKIKILDSNTIKIVSNWPKAELARTLRILPDGRVDWYDKWTNTSKEISAIPFRYRTGLANTESLNHLGGTKEVLEMEFSNNATVFYENAGKTGTGAAFSVEDDYARLILNAVSNNGIIEIFSPVLALAPGKSFVCRYNLHDVPNGGYWKFINRLRELRGLNDVGLERPFFFAPLISTIPGLDHEERIRRTLGDMGKITVVITPWFGQLGRSVMHKELPKGASYTEAYRRQRIIERKEISDKIALYKRLLPDAKIMCLHHPSMVTTYMPEFEKNYLADCAIRNKDGSPYFHEGYNSLILKEKKDQGWSIIYYLPKPGNPWYNMIMEEVDYALASGADGMYFDEFSFQTPRHYRRYDYSAWDGFSADVDENGNVTALKSDNARTTDLFKTALLQKLTRQGKLFLGNGGECSLTINCSAGYGFIEGTSLINMPQIHLYNVPLVLGNFGDESNRKGVFQAVREALKMGGIYTPHAGTNRFLEGRNNFVCRLYPITIRELGPGFIAAKERFITRESGTFNWVGAPDGEVELFIYDHSGERIKAGSTGKVVNGKITLNVPQDGMVIAVLK